MSKSCPSVVFSERELVCLSSVVCNARAPNSPTQTIVIFGNFSTLLGTLAIL